MSVVVHSQEFAQILKTFAKKASQDSAHDTNHFICLVLFLMNVVSLDSVLRTQFDGSLEATLMGHSRLI